MFLDTTFNSLETVLSSVYQNFYEAAMKYYRYQKSMAAASSPHAMLLISMCGFPRRPFGSFMFPIKMFDEIIWVARRSHNGNCK